MQRRELDARKKFAIGVSATITVGGPRFTELGEVYDAVVIQVTNNGESAVYGAHVHYDWEGKTEVWKAPGGAILPGSGRRCTLPYHQTGSESLPVTVTFRDAQEHWWKRTPDGTLTPLADDYAMP